MNTTKNAEKSNTASVSPHVALRVGQRTRRSSVQAPLKYSSSALTGLRRPDFCSRGTFVAFTLFLVTAADLAGFFAGFSLAEIRITLESSLLVLDFAVVFFCFAIFPPKLKEVCLPANCQYLLYGTSVEKSIHATLNTMSWPYILFGVSASIGAFMLVKIIVSTHRYTTRSYSEPVTTDLPTVSVCIPARNEMHALAECLERVLSSDYEKLEILVLDDSSSDDTPNIIKSFAHAGVRFVAGTPLPSGWLGKNHALQTLTNEASGKYLLFMDVDAHIGVYTISRLVREIEAHELDMLSVMPRRDDGLRLNALLGTARHLWELVLHTKDVPPSVSTVWMVNSSVLHNLSKGLESYGSSIRPDLHIAKHLRKTKKYRFYIGTKYFGLSYEKRHHSQLETAGRLYFALAGRKYLTALALLVQGILLLAPLALLVAYPLISIAGFLFSWLAFALFTLYTYDSRGALLRIALWPIVLIQDIVLLSVSMVRYATNSVIWKGRNVRMMQRDQAIVIDE